MAAKIQWEEDFMGKPVEIDLEKCTGCGLCVEVCPYTCLKLTESRVEYILDTCFLCGHCHAVCPEKAVSLAGYQESLGLVTLNESFVQVKPEPTVAAELLSIMRSRRSCRNYKDAPVDLEVLSDLVKIGTTAPSGTNSQGWNFTLLPTREDLMVLGEMVANYYKKLNRQAENPILRGVVKVLGGDSLGHYYRNYYESVGEALRKWDEDGEDTLFHGASAGILVSGSKEASCPSEDCLLATQNILLAAHTFGLGTCLIGFAVEAMRRESSIKEKMKLSDNEEIFSVIVLGHPAVQYRRYGLRKSVEPKVLRFGANV
jgi:nitroreductase/ferredoxin